MTTIDTLAAITDDLRSERALLRTQLSVECEAKHAALAEVERLTRDLESARIGAATIASQEDDLERVEAERDQARREAVVSNSLLNDLRHENDRLRVLVGDIAIRPEEHKPAPLPDGVPGELWIPYDGHGLASYWYVTRGARPSETYYHSSVLAAKVAGERETIVVDGAQFAARHEGAARYALEAFVKCIRAKEGG